MSGAHDDARHDALTEIAVVALVAYRAWQGEWKGRDQGTAMHALGNALARGGWLAERMDESTVPATPPAAPAAPDPLELEQKRLDELEH